MAVSEGSSRVPLPPERRKLLLSRRGEGASHRGLEPVSGRGAGGDGQGPSCKLLPGAGQTLDHPSTCRPLDERPQDPQGPRIPESLGSTLTPTCHPHPVCQPILSARLWDVSASSCFFPPCQPPPGRADPPAARPRCCPHSPQQPEGSVDMQIGFSHSL